MFWRWDQGRLDYFQFDTIRQIGKCLAALDGTILGGPTDPLRNPLMAGTELPFAPFTYRVWRNYKRVFGCQLLACDIDGKLICTQVCHELASGSGSLSTVDDYLTHISRRFYYPSPVFEGYSQSGTQVFPFCAVIKLLAAKSRAGRSQFVSIDEIISKLLGNKLTGKEPIAAYSTLAAPNISISGDQKRQVRELVRFLSQFSFLKWQSPNIFLDVASPSQDFYSEIEQLATPVVTSRHSERNRELISLGQIPGTPFQIPELKDRIYSEDEQFTEGTKVRVTHLRTERSRKLRELFFSTKNPPYSCNMCALYMHEKYPWTENLLEVHHLLPLSSPLKYEKGKTSIKDLVELCPNCHRAIHDFYRRWLRQRNQDDFLTYHEAHGVYSEAKERVAST